MKRLISSVSAPFVGVSQISRFIYQERPSGNTEQTSERISMSEVWGLKTEMIKADFLKMKLDAGKLWDAKYDSISNSISDASDGALDALSELMSSDIEQNNIRAEILLGNTARVSDLSALDGTYAKYFDKALSPNDYNSIEGEKIRSNLPFLNPKYDEVVMEMLMKNEAVADGEGRASFMLTLPLQNVRYISPRAAEYLSRFQGASVDLTGLDQNQVDPAVVSILARAEMNGVVIKLSKEQGLLRKLINREVEASHDRVSNVPQEQVIEQILNGYMKNVNQLKSESLTYEVARAIEKNEEKLNGILDLSGVDSITDSRIAEELADVDVKIFLLGVTDFQDISVAEEFADANAERLNFSNLKKKGTNPDVLKALFEHEGTIVLPKISRNDAWDSHGGKTLGSIVNGANAFVEDADFFNEHYGGTNNPNVVNASSSITTPKKKSGSAPPPPPPAPK